MDLNEEHPPVEAVEYTALQGRGVCMWREKKLVTVRGPEDIVKAMKRKRLHVAMREHFLIALLNARHEMVKFHTVSIGTLNASLVHPREVFVEAIKTHAAALILAHNHPSGDPEPSHEDISLTTRLRKGGVLLGIEVLDHIILGRDGFLSMKTRFWEAV